MKIKLPSKLKIGGGLLVLAILAGLYARAEFWKGKHAKAEAALVDMEVKALVKDREIKELKVLAMTPKQVEKELDVVYIKVGETSKVEGYVATHEQAAKCKACLDGQIKNDETVGKALGARNKAILQKDLAIRRKKKWKTISFIGIPVGILGGYVLSKSFNREKK